MTLADLGSKSIGEESLDTCLLGSGHASPCDE